MKKFQRIPVSEIQNIFEFNELGKRIFYPRLYEDSPPVSDSQEDYSDEEVPLDEFDVVTTLEGEKIDMKLLDREIRSARTSIMKTIPAFGSYIDDFTYIYTWRIPTMATDGSRIFMNPKFSNDLPFLGKVFVLLHELYHCILLHIERGEKFLDHELVNEAGDYEINGLLVDEFHEFFDENFVKNDIHGLYSQELLEKSMEEIYKLLENGQFPRQPKRPQKPGGGQGKTGKGGGQGGGQGKQPPIELKPGDKVRIKPSGEKGIVKSVNPDGTYEIEPINESSKQSFYSRLFEAIYRRDELIPIIPPGGGGGGEGGDGGEEVEIEGQGENKPGGGQGKSGKPSPGGKIQKGTGSSGGKVGKTKRSNGDETPEDRAYAGALASNVDPTNTGGIIPKKTGEEIAQKEGFGDSKNISADKWKNAAEKIFKELEKSHGGGGSKGGKNAGGGFSSLRKKLSKIIKGEAPWKKLLKRFIGRALSPAREYTRVNKKYLWQGEFREDRKRKQELLKRAVVGVDVSGSMYSIPNFLSRIIGEVNEMAFAKRIKEISLAFFTSIVHKDTIQIIKKASHTRPFIPESIPDGGGTDFRAFFKWIKDTYKDNVKLVVIFTDGYDQIPEPPKYKNDIIWVVYDNPNFNPGYGMIVPIASGDVEN